MVHDKKNRIGVYILDFLKNYPWLCYIFLAEIQFQYWFFTVCFAGPQFKSNNAVCQLGITIFFSHFQQTELQVQFGSLVKLFYAVNYTRPKNKLNIVSCKPSITLGYKTGTILYSQFHQADIKIKYWIMWAQTELYCTVSSPSLNTNWILYHGSLVFFTDSFTRLIYKLNFVSWQLGKTILW